MEENPPEEEDFRARAKRNKPVTWQSSRLGQDTLPVFRNLMECLEKNSSGQRRTLERGQRRIYL